jgi:hypothetical protein
MAGKIPLRARLSTNAIGVLLLMLVGTTGYLLLENLTIINAFYLSTCVITSVGLVIVPHTAAGKIFTVAFNAASLGQGILLLVEVADWRRERTRRMLRTAGLASAALDVAALLALALPTVCGAALVFQWLEGWQSFGESLYFCVIIATGLGLGDVEPRRPESRLFMCAYLLVIMGVVLHLLGLVGNAVHDGVKAGLAWVGVAPLEVGGGLVGGAGSSGNNSSGHHHGASAAAPHREPSGGGGSNHRDDNASAGGLSGR